MTIFTTPVASQSALDTWFAGIPSTVPSGDSYRAQLAAGTYTLNASYTGKTVSTIDAIIIEPQAGAELNKPNTKAAGPQSSGVVTINTSFGGTISVGSSFPAGFRIRGIQYIQGQNGNFNVNSGAILDGCLTALTGGSAGSNNLTFNGTGTHVNCICISNAALNAVNVSSSGATIANNLYLGFFDRQIFGAAGTSNNNTAKNCVAINLAGSADPWATPGAGFWSTTTPSSNNGTSFATAGNCPGTSVLTGIVGSAALNTVSSYAALNARPHTGSVLLAAGVTGYVTLDWYGDPRNNPPSVGPIEFVTSPVLPAANITLSGPSTCTVGTASSNFTAGADGAITGTITVTPSDGGAGGSFTPASVNISSGTPTATFTYTAASNGAKSISVANNGGLGNPSALSVTASGGATATTLSGPASGVVGSPSTNFTVGANGVLTGSVVVTPNDGGAGGSFTPPSVTISAGSPSGTFTYTAATSGAKTIATTNNGGLANPSNLTYTASGSAATAVTMSGPASGFVGSPSTNFTLGANGTISGTIVVTPSDGGAGGSFSPTTISLTAGSPTGAFTYTPASAGVKTISVTNNGGLSNPANINYTATAVPKLTIPLVNNTNTSLAATSVPNVVVMKLSDRSSVLNLTNQVANGSGNLIISNASLVLGTDYIAAGWNGDGSNAFVFKATAA